MITDIQIQGAFTQFLNDRVVLGSETIAVCDVQPANNENSYISFGSLQSKPYGGKKENGLEVFVPIHCKTLKTDDDSGRSKALFMASSVQSHVLADGSLSELNDELTEGTIYGCHLYKTDGYEKVDKEPRQYVRVLIFRVLVN